VFHGSVFTNHNSHLVDFSYYDLLDDDPVQSIAWVPVIHRILCVMISEEK
jgi:hypothetical protein